MKRLIVSFFSLACVGAMAAGLSDYMFVLPRGEVLKTDAFVVDDVNGLLSRALGKKLPVVTADKAPKEKRIYVRTIPNGFDFSQLTGKDAAIRVKNGDIWFFGRGANAVRFAAYDYLVVELGYRFFDARGGVKVPDLTGYEPKDADRIVRFDFPNRSVSSSQRSGREAALFHFRTGQNKNMEVIFAREGFEKGIAVDDYRVPWPHCHGLASYLPKTRNTDQTFGWIKELIGCDLEKTHPEYFTLTENGKHNPNHQPCLSHPEARRILKQTYFGSLARQERSAYNDLSAGDTGGHFCWCEACQALEKKYGTPGGPLLEFILSLSGEAAAKWPDQKILMLAYRKDQTEKPPVGFDKMPDNFVPDFAPIDDDFSKDWTHPNNAETLENLKGWCRLCKDVMVWYYPNPYGGALTPPLGNIGRLATDMKIMKELHATTALFEHNVGVREMTGFTELQSYLIARLFRDATLDWRELTREFFAFEYGAATPGVTAYLAELEELTRAMPSSRALFAWDAGHRQYTYLTHERLTNWETAFDEMARRLQDDAARLRNLNRLRINLDFAKFQIDKDISLAPRIRATLAEICEDAFGANYQKLGADFKKKIEMQLDVLELQYGPDAKPLPDEIFGSVPKGNLTICVMEVNSVKDKDAAYGTAAILRGDRRPTDMHLPFAAYAQTLVPTTRSLGYLGEGVTKEKLGPRDAYRFYDMGSVTLTRSMELSFASWFMRTRGISEAYKDGAFNKARVYGSLKFQGPAFYPDDTRENAVFCDRVVIVRDWDGKITCP